MPKAEVCRSIHLFRPGSRVGSSQAKLGAKLTKTPKGRKARTKQTALDHLSETSLILGVVVSSEFLDDDRFLAIVYATAELLDGMIFDGLVFEDANGDTLIEIDVED